MKTDRNLKFNIVLFFVVGIVANITMFSNGVFPAYAGTQSDYYKYNDTVLVINDASATSTSIANYFMQARGLSGTAWATTNVVHINTSEVENISLGTFNTDIRTPIKNFLVSNNIASSTNYMITTKGVPLKVGSIASVDQEIGNILGKYASYIGSTSAILNPYYNKDTLFTSNKYGYYIVTRLTGYTISGIKNMIDISDNATTTNQGVFVLDSKPNYPTTPAGYSMVNDWIVSASGILQGKGYPVILDKTNTYLTYKKNALGYYSWGSNDRNATTTLSGWTKADYLNSSITLAIGVSVVATTTPIATINVLNTPNGSFKFGVKEKKGTVGTIIGGPQTLDGYTWWQVAYKVAAIPHNTYMNGSIGDTAVSSSGRTFMQGSTYGQSLIADWLANGISGMQGYTSEPYTSGISHADILFNRYTHGYNFASSFNMADLQIGYKQVIVGDPKMVIIKHLPFEISSPANNAISPDINSKVSFLWNDMTDYYGISKYQLYIDGILNEDNIKGTSTIATLTSGVHTWYIKAINGNEYTATSTSIFAFNVIPGYARGYTFYVDNILGSDSNIGSQVSPWATFAKATNTAQAGDTVIIIKNSGVPYRETLTPVNNGNTTDGRITFRGIDATHKPEIWGSDDMSQSVVGGWTVYSGGNPNTYQKSVATIPGVVATGSSIYNLSKKTKGSVVNTLNTGEWCYSSGTLYYRLASGENISTLHMEVGIRDGIFGSVTSYINYKNLIIRYANSYGINIGSWKIPSSIVDNSEVYDSGGSGISISGNNDIVRYSISSGNTNYGVILNLPTNALVYNNVFSNNKVGLYVNINAAGSVVENNILSNNSLYDFQVNEFNAISLFASNNNWSGLVDSKWQSTYKGTNNKEATSPMFKDSSNRNFKLKQLSPNIDTAKSVSGISTDILGNPIYGAPDIGPYEYQPPYTIGTNRINISGDTRLYADGKYRYTNATSTTKTADFAITPKGGFGSGNYSEYMNVSISDWQTSGTYSKTWIENSSIATTTAHTIGDLKPNTYYTVKVDNSEYVTAQTDGSGQLSFNYSGGYSQHTFNVSEDTTNPTSPTPSTSVGTVSNSKPTLSWGSSSDPSGLSKYQLYIDGTLDTDNISSSATSATPTNSLNCGNHTWRIRAIDNAGNTTDSSTNNITMACGGGVFTGSVSSLPGYVKPKLQTIYPDGTIVYLDKKKDIPNKTQKTTLSPKTTNKTTPTTTIIREKIKTQITILQKTLVVVLSELVVELQKELQNIGKV